MPHGNLRRNVHRSGARHEEHEGLPEAGWRQREAIAPARSASPFYLSIGTNWRIRRKECENMRSALQRQLLFL